MIEKRRHRSDRCRLISVSAVCTRGERLHKIRDRPTESMNFFLEKLSEQYTDDYILLICDGAAWHKSTELIIPENIELFFIPPYTPEMNPIEQIWKEIRKRGFQNEVFDSLEAVIDRLCFTIKNLPAAVIKSITGRKWILSIF